MLLKDVVELSLSSGFTEESVYFLQSKISEHRDAFHFQSAFPDERLRPKHHYVEHYSELIKVFGSLSQVWTMLFEGKHKFFKKAVHHINDFKNIDLSLAVRHQKMMGFHLPATSSFKTSIEL